MADEGATPRELVLEACRRNNPDLLHEVLTSVSKQHPGPAATQQIARLLNSTRDGIGNGVLHVAAAAGAYETLDLLLDQEGLEIDVLDRLERDTALHKAVRYCNGLSPEDWRHGLDVVEILLDAGCDPRTRNGAKLRPMDLADPRNQELRAVLQKAEYSLQMGDDLVREDEDDGPGGSGSESD